VTIDFDAPTDSNDWRVTVQLADSAKAGAAAAMLSSHAVEDEVRRRLGGRVMVGTDGGQQLYLYAHTQDAASTAQESVSDLLSARGLHATYIMERWHPVAEQWEAADIALPGTEAETEAEHRELEASETQESLAEHRAMFEVRIQLQSHHDSVALAERLHAEGYSVVRRWRFVVVGANNADQAEEFAAKIQGEVPSGGVVSTEEIGPDRPYTAFEILAGEGL
jgi:hypothetical protein